MQRHVQSLFMSIAAHALLHGARRQPPTAMVDEQRGLARRGEERAGLQPLGECGAGVPAHRRNASLVALAGRALAVIGEIAAVIAERARRQAARDGEKLAEIVEAARLRLVHIYCAGRWRARARPMRSPRWPRNSVPMPARSRLASWLAAPRRQRRAPPLPA